MFGITPYDLALAVVLGGQALVILTVPTMVGKQSKPITSGGAAVALVIDALVVVSVNALRLHFMAAHPDLALVGWSIAGAAWAIYTFATLRMVSRVGKSSPPMTGNEAVIAEVFALSMLGGMLYLAFG